MVLRTPIAIPIGIGIIAFVIIISLFIKKSKPKYNKGRKIANTSYVKNTDYYKAKIRRYKMILFTLKGLCVLCMIISVFMMARLTSVSTKDKYLYNRDIFLCMDVSGSVNSLNGEIVASLKDTVKSLQGERFGIIIFNTSAVTLVPLTDDYDYVLNTLDSIEASIEANSSWFSTDNDAYYIINGVNTGYETYGSSLIGDGLVSCAMGFGDVKEDPDRTRIIIFSTDNALAGRPLYQLGDAAEFVKKRNILLYAVGTSNISKYKAELRDAALTTGGKYYQQGNSDISEVVDDINKTTKTRIELKGNTNYVDMPEIPFIMLFLSIALFIIISRVVRI